MKYFENYSLQHLNTFHLNVTAKRYIEVESKNELDDLVNKFQITSCNFLVLGGGSNVLFTKDYDGTIIHITFNELHTIKEDYDFIYLIAEAGMNWDDLVKYSVDKNLGGIENLAMIPGTVGAAPIQNIGAYGQEFKDTLVEVEYIDLTDKKIKSIANEQCHFGYRDSVFKKSLRGRFIITSVTLRLLKNPIPVLNYGNVLNELTKSGIHNPTIKDVSNIIRKIRTEKLPDPNQIGNAGSFFKNPVIDELTFQRIQSEYPDVPSYRQGNKIKIPAAWLIEKSGLKGHRIGDVGTYTNQPLVIVNYGSASGAQILEFAMTIQKTVKDKFNIELEPEVNII